MNSENFNTEMLLTLMAKLQFIAKAAKERGMQYSADPRYDAVELKAKDLLKKLERLIPAIMLCEIAHFQKVTKELYQLLGEHEENDTVKGNHGRDN